MLFFFFNDTATTEIYTLSLHDALPISTRPRVPCRTPPSHGLTRSREGAGTALSASVDSSLFFPGRLVWGRPVRAHRPHPHLECVAAIVVCDHPTRYGGTPSTVLDPRPCGYHRVHSLGALPDLE